MLYDEKLILKPEKEHTQNGFLVVLWKTDEIWELGMCTLWIKKNDSSDEWSLCVVYKSRITVSAVELIVIKVDQSVTGCINLALEADGQVHNW